MERCDVCGFGWDETTAAELPARITAAGPRFRALLLPPDRPAGWSGLVSARPDAPHGNFATSTSIPLAFASASVRPHHASSGSVNTTAGTTNWRLGSDSPVMALTARRASRDALCARSSPPAMSPMA